MASGEKAHNCSASFERRSPVAGDVATIAAAAAVELSE